MENVVGPVLVVNVRSRYPCRYPCRCSPTRCDGGAPSAASSSASTTSSMMSRTRSRISRSIVSRSNAMPSLPLLSALLLSPMGVLLRHPPSQRAQLLVVNQPKDDAFCLFPPDSRHYPTSNLWISATHLREDPFSYLGSLTRGHL